VIFVHCNAAMSNLWEATDYKCSACGAVIEVYRDPFMIVDGYTGEEIVVRVEGNCTYIPAGVKPYFVGEHAVYALNSSGRSVEYVNEADARPKVILSMNEKQQAYERGLEDGFTSVAKEFGVAAKTVRRWGDLAI